MSIPKSDTPTVEVQRVDLMDELVHRYGSDAGTFRQRLRYWRKKYLWLTAVGGASLIKRLIDIAAAGLAMILLSPLLIGTAVLIKLTDRGAVLFWQKRVGRFGREFDFPKFRSMVPNAESLKKELLDQSHHSDTRTFKMKRDPRVTWIGRIIRRFSIDELPQLWCVLHGDMSLVGPRPPVPDEVAQYTLRDRRRLDVKPGLTCIWQVSGRGDIPFEQQVQLDIDYIESQSLWVDVKLIVMTIPAVLLGRGAY